MEIEQRSAHSETRVLGSSHKPSVWQQFGVELGGVEDARCAALKEGKCAAFFRPMRESELHESMPSVSALPFSLFNMNECLYSKNWISKLERIPKTDSEARA